MLVSGHHTTPAQVGLARRGPRVQQRCRDTGVAVHDGETTPRLQVIRKRARRPLGDGERPNRVRRMGHGVGVLQQGRHLGAFVLAGIAIRETVYVKGVDKVT